MLRLNGKKILFCQILYHKETYRNLKFPSSCPHNALSFILLSRKKKRKEEEKAGESLQYSGILSPGYSQSLPSLSCVYILRPRFPPCSGRGFPVLCGRGQRGGTGCPPAPGIASRFVLPRITGSPAETHPSGGGTQGGELATGCWKASQHRRTPWLLGDVAGWLAGSSI